MDISTEVSKVPASDAQDPPGGTQGVRFGRSGSETDEEDHESEFSSDDDTSDDSDEAMAARSNKRKRSIDDDGDDMEALVFEQEWTETRSNYAEGVLDHLAPSLMDWALAGTLVDRACGNQRRFAELTDTKYVNTAQIVADQVVSGSLGPVRTPVKSQTDVDGLFSMSVAAQDEDRAQLAVRETFPLAVRCSLEAYASVQDILPELGLAAAPAFARPNAYARRLHGQSSSSSDSALSATSNIVELPPPHVVVRRGDSAMEILPVALGFWEALGLGPLAGSKDVTAFCVYPPGNGLRGAADGFLDRIGSAYKGCRLGDHTKGDAAGFSGGLVPVSIHAPDPGGTTIEGALAAVRETCIELGESDPAWWRES